MKKRLYNFGVINITIFTLITSIYLVIINSISKYSNFKILQQITAKIVYLIQNMLGITVTLQDTTLNYIELFSIRVTLLCTGINEILFFSLILLGFTGISLRTKLKGYAIFFPIILVENIIRLIILQPLAVRFGKEAALNFHNFSFKYGQIIFILILVIIWFHYFAKKEFRKSVQNYKQEKHSKLKQTIKKRKD